MHDKTRGLSTKYSYHSKFEYFNNKGTILNSGYDIKHNKHNKHKKHIKHNKHKKI